MSGVRKPKDDAEKLRARIAIAHGKGKSLADFIEGILKEKPDEEFVEAVRNRIELAHEQEETIDIVMDESEKREDENGEESDKTVDDPLDERTGYKRVSAQDEIADNESETTRVPSDIDAIPGEYTSDEDRAVHPPPRPPPPTGTRGCARAAPVASASCRRRRRCSSASPSTAARARSRRSWWRM